VEPIGFTCSEVLPLSSREICAEIARVEGWSGFAGYGIVPGIAHAEYETRTAGVTGSRIRVRNRDGSRHVEEVLEWDPDRRVVMRIAEFSPPLDRVCERFVETWTFEPREGGTLAHRAFALYPRSRPARLLLRGVSFFLRRAIERHLAQMKRSARG